MLRENTGGYLWDLRIEEDFLNKTLKNLNSINYTFTKVERQATNREIIDNTAHRTNKRLRSRIYEELRRTPRIRKNKPAEKWTEDMSRHPRKSPRTHRDPALM